jgi:hypothetical protein
MTSEFASTSHFQTQLRIPAPPRRQLSFSPACSAIVRISGSSGELDDHFGFPVIEKIEQVNSYFKERLRALVETN